MKRTLSRTVPILAIAIFALGLFVGPAAHAKGTDVTFINRSDRTQYVLAAFGADGSCSDMPQRENLVIDSKQMQTVQSGDSKVCWCSSRAGKIGDCTDTWKKARPGSKQRIEF